MMNESQEMHNSHSDTKRSYSPLKVSKLGNLNQLTQGSLGAMGDGMGGMQP